MQWWHSTQPKNKKAIKMANATVQRFGAVNGGTDKDELFL
jgi:hypothetical protein